MVTDKHATQGLRVVVHIIVNRMHCNTSFGVLQYRFQNRSMTNESNHQWLSFSRVLWRCNYIDVGANETDGRDLTFS
jgi:hypothetical protein